MRAIIVATLATALAAGCGAPNAESSGSGARVGSTGTVTTESVYAPRPEEWTPKTRYTVNDYLDMMSKSKVTYEVQLMFELEDRYGEQRNPPEPDPLLAARMDDRGDRQLYRAQPPPAVAALLAQASAAVAAGEPDKAFALYEQAVVTDRSYFKSHTYLGNMLLIRKDYEAAEYHLNEAITLNPLDYQAHLFLAELFHTTDRPAEALHEITTAFTLNRNNSNVRSLLRSILADHGLQPRADLMVLPGRLARRGNTVLIQVLEHLGPEWQGYLGCIGMWKWDPALAAQRVGHESAWTPRMLAECMQAHVTYLASLVDKKIGISTSGSRIYTAVKHGYFRELVVWDVLAPSMPTAVAALTNDYRARVVEYVRVFAYVHN